MSLEVLARGWSMAWQPTNRYSIIRTGKKSFFSSKPLVSHPALAECGSGRKLNTPLPSSGFKVSGTIHSPLPHRHSWSAPRQPFSFVCLNYAYIPFRWQQNIQTSQKSQPISRFRTFDVQVGLLRHYLWFATGQLAWTVKSEEIIWNSNWRVR